MLSKTTKATLKSGAFLATFVTVYQYQICMHRQLLKTGLIGRWNSKYLYGLAGFICSYLSIFIEDKKRRSELALYVLPKAVHSLYQIAYSHHWIFKMKYFEVLMASTAMGIIMVKRTHSYIYIYLHILYIVILSGRTRCAIFFCQKDHVSILSEKLNFIPHTHIQAHA